MKKYTLILLLFLSAMAQANAQLIEQSFIYPQMPDTLRTVEQRMQYLAIHYWDNFDFTDVNQLNNADIVEQGFVNYIDILPRFPQDIAQQSVAIFASKAFGNIKSKEKFENLIEHYLDDPESPMKNDRTYLLFLGEMNHQTSFDETEKERLAFKIKRVNKNLPGDIAIDFKFADKEGKYHLLSNYKDQKVILYFYDPDCENCHRVSNWLSKQTIPADYTLLEVHADDTISDLYSLQAMPTIYLLDKGNVVILKDCTPEMLINAVSQ